MQKLSKKEVDIVTKLLKFKIRTESPFDLKRSDDKIKKQMVEFFIDEVFNDIVLRKYPLDMDEDTLTNFIRKLVISREFMNMPDVYRNIPEYVSNTIKKIEETSPAIKLPPTI